MFKANNKDTRTTQGKQLLCFLIFSYQPEFKFKSNLINLSKIEVDED